MANEEYDDYDSYDEDDDDFEELLVVGMLHDEEVRSHKSSGGGCLTTVLMFVFIPFALIIMILKDVFSLIKFTCFS